MLRFLLRFSLRKNDPNTPEGKREIIKEVGPVFAQITHAVEKDFYINKSMIFEIKNIK